jgi:Ni,Fe-hydrogenase III large subunit/Ni,Fe-hydrogenase III component G
MNALLTRELGSLLGNRAMDWTTRGAEIFVQVDAQTLPDHARAILTRDDAAFADLFGRERDGLEIHLLFALDADNTWLHLVAPLDCAAPQMPTLTRLIPAATWYERELHDELGVDVREHPGMTRLRLPADFPRDILPHRGDFVWTRSVPYETPEYPTLTPAPNGVVDYPLGPVREGVVESAHYTLRTVGEEIVDAALRPFYKHRGVEKRAEGLPLVHLPLVAERISGTSAFAHSLALCQALEALAAVDAPPRAQRLRVVLAELERLYNHFAYHAELCQATGLVVGQAQMEILKERVLRLNAALVGHRYLFGANVVGGLAVDLDADAQQRITVEVTDLRRQSETLASMLTGSASHIDRLEATGILPREQAHAYGAVGPVGRASGIDRDTRRDHPYAAYADLAIEVPVHSDGDALARFKVRLDEIRASIRLIEQALDQMPAGPVRVEIQALPAQRAALGWAESPRGEILHWVATDAQGALQRWRVRSASFANAQVFPLAIPGRNILTDFPIIEQSFALSYAGCDR